jgi:tripartite-type tricarboxylate transporter receptor subunit TctC
MENMGNGAFRIASTVFFCAAVGCALPSWGQSAPAQAGYPNRAIQLIVPWAPSGPTDVYARLIAAHLQSAWGQPVVVDNRAGAAGTIGAGFVAKAPADGYTLLFNSVTNVIAPLLQKDPAYDPVEGFEPVAMAARMTQLIIVGAGVPSRTLQEFIAYARKQPGKLNYASPGMGSIGHLVMEIIKEQAQIDLQHIPYKGGAPVLTALLSNEVQVGCSDIVIAKPQIEAGKVRVLAQLAPERSALMPDVPTITQAGLSDFGVVFWNGLFAPKGTPAAIVAKLNQEVNRAMVSAAVVQKAAAFGSETVSTTPAAFRARVAQDFELYGTLVRRKRIVGE